MSKIVMLLMLSAAVSMLNIEFALAIGAYPIDGTVRDVQNNKLLSGVYVRNETNITQWDLTGADGFYNLTGFYTDSNTTLWFNASGYVQQAVTVVISAGGQVTYTNASGVITNGSTALYLVPVTPVNGAVTVSGITKNSATVAWTVNTPTDNVSNNYVDQILIITALGVPNQTQAWTNSSLTNSYSLTNLNSNQVYTYYAITYNTANNAFTAQDTTTFTTLRAGAASSWTPEPTPAPKKSVLEIVTTGGKTRSQRNIIIFITVAVVVIIVYYGVMKRP